MVRFLIRELFAGCLNGGAQIRPMSGTSSKELISSLESLYKGLPKVVPNIQNRIHELYSEWIGDEDEESVKNKLHTTYKQIEQNVNPLGIKW